LRHDPKLATWLLMELREQLEKELLPLPWMAEHMMGPEPLQLTPLHTGASLSCPAERLWPISWAVRRVREALPEMSWEMP
jgi:hypothetical protein